MEAGRIVMMLAALWLVGLSFALSYESAALLLWSFVPVAIAVGIMFKFEPTDLLWGGK